MKPHRIGLALVAGVTIAFIGLGCGAETAQNEDIAITGTSAGSDAPQTQEEYMKRQMEMQKGAYKQAEDESKKK